LICRTLVDVLAGRMSPAANARFQSTDYGRLMLSAFEIIAILLTLTAVFAWVNHVVLKLPNTIGLLLMALAASLVLVAIEIKNHQLSWWFDGEPLKAVLKDSATFGMGLWDH
jgi:hypothetical protein